MRDVRFFILRCADFGHTFDRRHMKREADCFYRAWSVIFIIDSDTSISMDIAIDTLENVFADGVRSGRRTRALNGQKVDERLQITLIGFFQGVNVDIAISVVNDRWEAISLGDDIGQ